MTTSCVGVAFKSAYTSGFLHDFTGQKQERRGSPRRPDASGQRPYAHFGSPSLLAGARAVVPT
jgi:hypothetical protein